MPYSLCNSSTAALVLGSGKSRTADFGLCVARGESFHLANGHTPASDSARQREARLGIRNGEKGAGMAGGEAALFEQFLDWLFQLQQADGVGDGGAVFSSALGDLFLGEVEFVNQPLEGMRLLDGVQIFALEVFDERHLQRHFFGNVADYHRHAAEVGSLGGTPAAFSGDQLKAAGNPADDERLDDSTGANRAGQLFQGFLAES